MSYENGTMEYEKYHTYDEAGAEATDADKACRKERIATALMAGIYANSAYADIDCRMASGTSKKMILLQRPIAPPVGRLSKKRDSK